MSRFHPEFRADSPVERHAPLGWNSTLDAFKETKLTLCGQPTKPVAKSSGLAVEGQPLHSIPTLRRHHRTQRRPTREPGSRGRDRSKRETSISRYADSVRDLSLASLLSTADSSQWESRSTNGRRTPAPACPLTPIELDLDSLAVLAAFSGADNDDSPTAKEILNRAASVIKVVTPEQSAWQRCVYRPGVLRLQSDFVPPLSDFDLIFGVEFLSQSRAATDDAVLDDIVDFFCQFGLADLPPFTPAKSLITSPSLVVGGERDARSGEEGFSSEDPKPMEILTTGDLSSIASTPFREDDKYTSLVLMERYSEDSTLSEHWRAKALPSLPAKSQCGTALGSTRSGTFAYDPMVGSRRPYRPGKREPRFATIRRMFANASSIV